MKDTICIVCMLEFFILITPLFFIAFDFWAGTRKAKQRGEDITSDGWQRTISKIARYYNALLALMVVDAMQIVACWYFDSIYSYSLPLFPFITLAGALAVAAIEIKSIYEKADEKAKKDVRQVTVLANEIYKHKADATEIAKAVVDYLNNQKEHGKN